MNDFLKMDIFFVVTTIVVIVIGVLVALILIRLYRIMGHLEHLSEQAEEEATLIRADLAEMRGNIKRGMRWGAATLFMRRLGKRFFGSDV